MHFFQWELDSFDAVLQHVYSSQAEPSNIFLLCLKSHPNVVKTPFSVIIGLVFHHVNCRCHRVTQNDKLYTLIFFIH